MKSVKLKTAFTWLCSECGNRNFELSAATDGDDAVLDSLPDEFEAIAVPDEVTCRQCRKKFKVDEPA